MKKLSFIALLLFMCMVTHAQILERQVIASSGGYSTDTSGISVSWTLGEVAIQTLESDNADIILTQGFQQPDPDTVVAALETIAELGVSIFPNPVSQTLNIQLDKPHPAPLKVQLVDAAGRTLQLVDLNGTSLELEMGDYPAGMYVLVFRSEGLLFSRKVLKQ